MPEVRRRESGAGVLRLLREYIEEGLNGRRQRPAAHGSAWDGKTTVIEAGDAITAFSTTFQTAPEPFMRRHSSQTTRPSRSTWSTKSARWSDCQSALWLSCGVSDQRPLSPRSPSAVAGSSRRRNARKVPPFGK
jgi:hypothetical protein